MKKTMMKFLGLAALVGLGLSAWATPVAKVGTQEFESIDDAMAAWNAGTTLTLLADVQLSAAKSFSSADAARTLNLSTFTLTAAKNKNAIEITFGAIQNAANKLTITADSVNPGGITVPTSGKYAVYYNYNYKSGKDRVGVTIERGVYNGGVMYMRTAGGTKAGNVYLKGGVYNGSFNFNRESVWISGGQFNGTLTASVDSTCRLYLQGGSFKTFPTQTWSADLPAKMVLGSKTGTAVTSAQINANPENYPQFSGVYNYLNYSTTPPTPAYPLDKDGNYMWTDPPSHTAYVYVGSDDYFHVESTNALPARLAAREFEASVTKNDVSVGVHDVWLAISDVKVPVYYVSAAKAMTHTGVNKAITFYVPTDVSNTSLTGADGNTFTVNLENGVSYTGEIGFTGGYEAVKTVNGNVITYTASLPVAQIGETKFFTLADAIDAAADGATVTLLKNVSESGLKLAAGTSLTIDQNGKTLAPATAGAKVFGLERGAALTVIGAFDAEALCEGALACDLSYDTSVDGQVTILSALNPDKCEAKVGDEYYPTVKDAFAAAEPGATVTVTKAVALAADGGLVVEKDLTLDLAGERIAAPTPEAVAITVKAGACGVIDSIGGGKVSGQIVVEDGASLVIYAGTFDFNPTDYIPSGKVVRPNGDGTWTVADQEVHVREELPEVNEIKTADGQPIPEEKQAAVNEAIENLKTEIVQTLSSSAVVSEETGIKNTVRPDNADEIVAALQQSATAMGLTEGAKAQIAENIADLLDPEKKTANSSNYLDIAICTFDTKVKTEGSVEATATTLRYEVKPIITTVVANTVGGETKKEVVEAVIPNETVKALAEAGTPMTFTLPVNDPAATCAIVTHRSDDPERYPVETFVCPVEVVDGVRVVRIVPTHFSEWEVTTTAAVLVDSDETVGILKLDRTTAGEVSFGVPFTKSGVAAETPATLAELVVTGAQAGDAARAWTPGADDQSSYAAVAASAAPAAGTAVWYDRAADSDIPLAVAGYEKAALAATGAASATDRPGMTLFANPNAAAFDALAVLASTPVDGDRIVVEGDATRYFYADGDWRRPVPATVAASKEGVAVRGEPTDEAVLSIPVPAGKTFWYVTQTGTPSVQW